MIDADPEFVRTIRVHGVDRPGVVLRYLGRGVAALYWNGEAWREVMTKRERVLGLCTLSDEQRAALAQVKP